MLVPEIYNWCQCGYRKHQGTISHTVYMLMILIILQKYFLCLLENHALIRSQFCTCPDSYAVGTCAKLWPGKTITIKIITFFSENWIVSSWIVCQLGLSCHPESRFQYGLPVTWHSGSLGNTNITQYCLHGIPMINYIYIYKYISDIVPPITWHISLLSYCIYCEYWKIKQKKNQCQNVYVQVTIICVASPNYYKEILIEQ